MWGIYINGNLAYDKDVISSMWWGGGAQVMFKAVELFLLDTLNNGHMSLYICQHQGVYKEWTLRYTMVNNATRPHPF